MSSVHVTVWSKIKVRKKEVNSIVEPYCYGYGIILHVPVDPAEHWHIYAFRDAVRSYFHVLL